MCVCVCVDVCAAAWLTTACGAQVSEELGHPAGELDVETKGGSLVSLLLKRAMELTGSGASHLRLAHFLELSAELY